MNPAWPEWLARSRSRELQQRVEALPLETLRLGRVTFARLVAARRVAAGLTAASLAASILFDPAQALTATLVHSVIAGLAGLNWLATMRLGYRLGTRLDAAEAYHRCINLGQWYHLVVSQLSGLTALVAGILVLDRVPPGEALLRALHTSTLFSAVYVSLPHARLLAAMIGLLGTTPPRVKAATPSPTWRERMLAPAPRSIHMGSQGLQEQHV